MRYAVHPEDVENIIKAYGKVIDNLNAHVHPENQYTPADEFLAMIKSGPALYGMEALKDDIPISEGASLLIERVDESEESTWVLGWGGANVLAQALYHLRKSRSETQVAQFCSKVRFYSISDQDDSGPWIRHEFPKLFYICSIHGWKQYTNATWFGISGDVNVDFDSGGPDVTKVKMEWLSKNIQIGPLGAAYPKTAFIMEGDTPTFLNLIQNGLSSPEHPEWGGWGGRYSLLELSGASAHFVDASDIVVKDGRKYHSNHATIWRWRDHFQDSFAARIQWTLTKDIRKCNHAPVVEINGSTGVEPLFLEAEAGSEIELDATATYDPDGDDLDFHWFHYKDVSTAHEFDVQTWKPKDIEFQRVDEKDGRKVKLVLPPAEWSAVDRVTGKALEKGCEHHFILQVTDRGSPPLTTYKRVVVQTTNKKLLGARKRIYESTADCLGIWDTDEYKSKFS